MATHRRLEQPMAAKNKFSRPLHLLFLPFATRLTTENPKYRLASFPSFPSVKLPLVYFVHFVVHKSRQIAPNRGNSR
jgi:hypothetical protein